MDASLPFKQLVNNMTFLHCPYKWDVCLLITASWFATMQSSFSQSKAAHDMTGDVEELQHISYADHRGQGT